MNFNNISRYLRILSVLLFGSLSADLVIASQEAICEQENQQVVKQINPCHYVGHRVGDKDLNFVMVKLTDESIKTWQDFAQGQNTACLRIWDEITENDKKPYPEQPKEIQKYLRFINITRPGGKVTILDGLMAFRESLELYKSHGSEVWIACALAGHINPSSPITEELFPHIEMALTVLTSPAAPFTIHMGIARTVYHAEKAYKKELPHHSGLSMALHGFAAQAISLYDPQKIFMITYPAFPMVEVIEKTLLPEEYLCGKAVSKVYQYDEKGNLQISNFNGEIVKSISADERQDKTWSFIRHFYFGRPLQPYAFDLKTLGRQFSKRNS
ncbi:hypothetical protein [Candidatus Odyssella thessalonicensis]|uniref:hypothetical protein n=1 Tax=Candidatus Odyssella thessalonicensis TaxID=84647 RepID=UPI000225BFAA|nr:hypothetical protein [Candidatus Odyssella thessalonicensis]